MFNDIDELKDFLIDQAEYEEDELEQMRAKDLLDAWLCFHRVEDMTENIINVVEIVYGIEL